MEIENDEKTFELMNNEMKTLENVEKDFQKHLNKKRQNSNDNKNNYDIENVLKNRKKTVQTFINANKINQIHILDNIKIDVLIQEISKHFNDNFEMKKIVDIKENNHDNTILNTINNKISWKFDHIHDYRNRGSKMHSIENNGKKLVCNHNSWFTFCTCFFISYSFGMKPQSGKYKIKIKIDKIDDLYRANMIGIISQHSKNNMIIKNNQNNYKILEWWNQLDDYIGWGAHCGRGKLLHGLVCGNNQLSCTNNIFRQNKFVYKSNNDNYKDKLPGIETGDIVILSYDSNNQILSFCKENDNGKLNAQISNLPKENTYYWFVGHMSGKMCLSVVAD